MWTARASSSAPTSCSGAARSRYCLPLTVAVPLVGAVEAEDQPHRRRLAGAVGAEEAGDDPGLDREGEVVDGDLLAVTLAESVDLDHLALTVDP